MSVFFDMFVPSRRHLEEERNRQEWTRDEEGEGDPYRGPIDLDSGVVTIKREITKTPEITKTQEVTKPEATRTRPAGP